ncbi:MAG TPA: hypothetical protein VGN09_20785 [Vicinamibacteria bacterium]|jgi:hypothetical protein
MAHRRTNALLRAAGGAYLALSVAQSAAADVAPRLVVHAGLRAPVQVERTERYLSRLEALLGERGPARVEYFRYETTDEVGRATGIRALGVTFVKMGQIHSTLAFHPHELVHVVAGPMGDPGTFFQEGLAVALGDEGRWNGRAVDAMAKRVVRGGELSRLVDAFDSIDPDVAYPAAGSFVASLIRGHGIASVAAFFRACHGSVASRDRAFEASFGLTLDQALVAWAARL